MKIDVELIKNIKNIEGLFKFFGKNPLYSQFKEVSDIFISICSDMVNLILNYSRQIFNKDKNIREMIDILHKNFTGSPCKDYNYFIDKVSSPDEEKKYIDNFLKFKESLKSLNKNINDFNFFKFISDFKI